VECPRESSGNLVLGFREARGIGLETVRPKVRAAFGVDQLRVYANLIARSLYAAFDDIADDKLAADLLYVDGLALVGEGGAAGDYEASLDAREIGRQIVGDRVGEILLLRVIAEIGKGSTTIDRRAGGRALLCRSTASTERASVSRRVTAEVKR
jgi:hypothetical protein